MQVLVGRSPRVHPREAIGPCPHGRWLRSRDARGRVRHVRRARTRRCASWRETLGYELGLQAVPARCTSGASPSRARTASTSCSTLAAMSRPRARRRCPTTRSLARTIFLLRRAAADGSRDPHLDVLAARGSGVRHRPAGAWSALARLGIARAPASARVHPARTTTSTPTPSARSTSLFLGARRAPRATRDRAAGVLGASWTRVSIASRTVQAISRRHRSRQSGRSLLAQAKVVINLHGGESTRWSGGRVLDAIHAGAVVVTEHSSGIAPLVAGEHLLVASADALPFVAEALLRDPSGSRRCGGGVRAAEHVAPVRASGGGAASGDRRAGGGARARRTRRSGPRSQ